MRQRSQMRTVDSGKGKIEYLLTRKQVKNINLRINRNGEIRVSAYPGISAAYIDRFVLSKEDFIFNALQKFSQARENATQKKLYLDGENLYILGKPLTLFVEAGTPEGVRTDGKSIHLIVRDPENAASREKLIKGWLREVQERIFDEICRRVYPSFEKLGIGYPQIKIREMKSRWGSCRPAKGSITLNSRLAAMPEACIEYVVLHEFSHFIHPNHSGQFHEFVGSFMPDWRERKKLLEKCNHAGMGR